MKDLALSMESSSRYKEMMTSVSHRLPSIDESNKSFYKSASQIKTVSLDITDLTDIGAAKHILARIERKRMAIKESEINIRRKKIELARAHERFQEVRGLEADEVGLEILELESQIDEAVNYQQGGVREIAFLVKQYEAICERLGVEIITEEMYEADQPRYHVIRAFSQALAAARSRGGLIDEGNFIYLQDLGINGAAAQRELSAYLQSEQQLLDQQIMPTYEMQYSWLMAIGDKYAPQVELYARHKGFIPFVPEALAQEIES